MTVFVNAIMYYKAVSPNLVSWLFNVLTDFPQVKDAISAVINVDDYGASARLLAATTLRNVLGTKNLGDILSDREAIAQDMQVSSQLLISSLLRSAVVVVQATLDEATDPWGVTVERVEVKDVRVPESLQRAMAAEAEAAREARAKVIAAEGEHKASRALKQAAEVIVDSPAALQLRYLQTLNSISAENNSTIVFPVPVDVLNTFMGGSNSGSQRHKVDM